MPPKSKAATKPKATEPAPATTNPTTTTTTNTSQTASSQEPSEPTTVLERSQQRYEKTRPFEAARRQHGLSKLSKEDQKGWICDQLLHLTNRLPAASRARLLSPKASKEIWWTINGTNSIVRGLKQQPKAHTTWGTDRNGHDVGSYSIERFDERIKKRAALTALQVSSRVFRENVEREKRGFVDARSGQEIIVTEREIDEEKVRRSKMTALKKELYGEITGKLASSVDWEDVVPTPHEEPEGALAAIAYPAEYAEAMSYLRAVMSKKEYSPRCLRLTEHIIGMNAAHYTVWLYRAANIFALGLSIPDEIEWLNEVALANLKNYQIWHHRHLLVEHYHPTIASDAEALAHFAKQERDFLIAILSEDTKNYHVWSYRSWLVGKLEMWEDSEELKSIETLIDEDVRNNSAWSHRFFLVFSNPKYATPGKGATERDDKVTQELVDREVQYAQTKVYLAPQNQSPWNYMRGVLVKGGRQLASVQEFVEEFVVKLGEGDDQEEVRSTHALDFLAEIYAEKGESEKADLCLRRLAEKWDRIRRGYWEWRRKCLTQGSSEKVVEESEKAEEVTVV
ncbi:hypothetical protein SMACR_03092 [Sordaria macrospora]|uniref:Protein farnesyltransferase/geranylgeranyltransferase type-1 subunit alpha n=2 Tax=Sordaria macrospora TaxID=5147 RepID=F7VU91_SORMK|nr:uncharacterized protein SMAC_03092 [Sordaria macrospora k-hell]KAA8628073.1 hypothetical protein SMACR_03092 [Sordaria macrospora]WPJ60660.1 hypothetical protein SMAC4_03092 [Sordaria macrospora]CCC09079.1 unnamed protein product [Sordaria macrospora k-hell]